MDRITWEADETFPEGTLLVIDKRDIPRMTEARQFVRDAIGNQRAGMPAASWVEGEEPYGMWDYMRLSSEGRERVWRAVCAQERV